MGYVYAFTNENLTCLKDLYDFKDKKVLTVLGSGDQYFSSVLFGANEVDVYDIEPKAWDYFVLKFSGIINLDYDDFFQYFVREDCMNNDFFRRLEEYLLDRCSKNIGNFLSYSDVIEPKYDNGKFIPYFSKEQFYVLKELLTTRGLPKFYNENLKNLSCKLEKSYDILLASNILFNLYNIPGSKDVKEFKEMLEKFNCSQIEALYGFGLNDFLEKDLIDSGFDIERVQSGTRMMLDDYVVSLRKRIC